MMAHLIDAIEDGKDVGHYGRLVFTMVGRYFMDEEEIVGLLAKQPDMDREDARALYAEVKAHDYNPPKRTKILEWQRQQDFPILPDAEDPDSGNVYEELRFPDEVYERIGEYWEDRVEAGNTS
jgi:hypothetical protein